MKLVVNTNILFSFFRENPVRELIIDSKSFGLELYTPKYAFSELRDNKSGISKYSGIKTDGELEFALSALKFFIKVPPVSFFEDMKDESRKISPDPKDAPFFALALKLDCAIWSNEPRLKRQSMVNVFNTRELMKFLGLG